MLRVKGIRGYISEDDQIALFTMPKQIHKKGVNHQGKPGIGALSLWSTAIVLEAWGKGM